MFASYANQYLVLRKMRILFLSRWYPYPSDNGSKIRIRNLLEGLATRHKVTLISFFSERDTIDDPGGNGPDEIHTCCYRSFNPVSVRSILGFLRAEPRSVVDTYSPDMASLIGHVVRRQKPDLVVASQLEMASYYWCYSGSPAIFEEAELGMYCPQSSAPEERWLQFRKQLTWQKHKRFVARLLAQHNACTVASNRERVLLSKAAPQFRDCHVIPNAINLKEYQPVSAKSSNDLIFTGSLRFEPNFQAMEWFVREILPRIVEQVPDVRLRITGDVPSRALTSTRHVIQTGRLHDIRPALAASAVSIAPIRTGGGTRLKILESLALRTPVVATSKAMEGLEAKNDEHLLVANEPTDFAYAVVRLLCDRRRARRLAENGYRLVLKHYDWAGVLPRFLELVDEASSRCAPGYPW